jgi:hypothetical protein
MMELKMNGKQRNSTNKHSSSTVDQENESKEETKDLWIEKTLTFPYLSSLTTYKKMKMRIEIRIEMRMRVREG